MFTASLPVAYGNKLTTDLQQCSQCSATLKSRNKRFINVSAYAIDI